MEGLVDCLLLSNLSEDDMEKYVCDICGYEYNPAEGDADSGIAAGTSFKDLPDNWVCPVCGAGKSDFSPA